MHQLASKLASAVTMGGSGSRHREEGRRGEGSGAGTTQSQSRQQEESHEERHEERRQEQVGDALCLSSSA